MTALNTFRNTSSIQNGVLADYKSYYALKMDIGAEIKRAREMRGLTQTELAERCGWEGQARISHLEKNRRDLRVGDMVTIEKALELTPGTLVRSMMEVVDLDALTNFDGNPESIFEVLSSEEKVKLVGQLMDRLDSDDLLVLIRHASHVMQGSQEPPGS